jgi:hypothetical protein
MLSSLLYYTVKQMFPCIVPIGNDGIQSQRHTEAVTYCFQVLQIVSKSFKSRFICVDYLHVVDIPSSHFDADIPGPPVSGVGRLVKILLHK